MTVLTTAGREGSWVLPVEATVLRLSGILSEPSRFLSLSR